MQTAISTSRAKVTQPARAAQQILIRLPYDLACQLAKSVPHRGRNQYVVDVLKRELESEKAAHSRMLTEAAIRMNEIEAAHPELVAEALEWDNAKLLDDDDDDDFDPVQFEREFAIAQAAMKAKKIEKVSKA
jgi:hypothetical protein